MAFKYSHRCPGCGRILGREKTIVPIPTKPYERVKINGCWYCGRCGWEMKRYSKKMILIPPVICPGCGKKIIFPWKTSYADGKPCCADCQTKIFEVAQDRKAQEAEQTGRKPGKKNDKWIGGILATRADSPDHVTLISMPCSNRDTMLDTLILTRKDNVPAVQWGVSWRGGISHADGAGSTTPLPKELLIGLTPKTLVEWLSKQSYGDLYDMTKFTTDERVDLWCSHSRAKDSTLEHVVDIQKPEPPTFTGIEQS